MKSEMRQAIKKVLDRDTVNRIVSMSLHERIRLDRERFRLYTISLNPNQPRLQLDPYSRFIEKRNQTIEDN